MKYNPGLVGASQTQARALFPRGALGFVPFACDPPTQPGPRRCLAYSSCEAGLALWQAAETDCGSSIDHWRPLWHQERAEGAQLAERESLRMTGTFTHRQFLNSSPGYKGWCYELTRRKDSADEARVSASLGLFSSYFLTHFPPLGLGLICIPRDAGFLYGENAFQK